jgi:hypothetical protein
MFIGIYFWVTTSPIAIQFHYGRWYVAHTFLSIARPPISSLSQLVGRQETDYYLHNFHVKAGRGTMYSMKTYQRAFGIDWPEEGRDGREPAAPTPPPLAKASLFTETRRVSGNNESSQSLPIAK